MLVVAQYSTGDEWVNNTRKNEGIIPYVYLALSLNKIQVQRAIQNTNL